MPKLMTSNPEVRVSLRRWPLLDRSSGYRWVAPGCVQRDHHDFWREFRQVVKQAKLEALIVGEIGMRQVTGCGEISLTQS